MLLHLASASILLAASAPPFQPQEAASLAERVNRAIDAGVVHLKSIQRDDGHFPCDHTFQDGTTALCGYALLKSGVPADDPSIMKAMAALHYAPLLTIYSTSCRIAMFDAHGGAELDEPIRAAAQWIEENQHGSGRFAYPHGQPDLSNSQYAALGLWIASRHGFEAKRDTWAELLKELVRLQLEDGGFGYREDDGATGSMTTAAIAMAELANNALAGDSRHGSLRRKGEQLLEKAWQWLEGHFAVDGNPLASREVVTSNHLYYLYGLERVGAIGERTKIGDHDWYAEGARHLVRTQRQNGQWSSPDATSFALLFLRRATFTGMKKTDAEQQQPLGGPITGEPKRPGGLVPFVRRWFICGPIADPKDTLLEEEYSGEAKVEPAVGASFRGKSWREARQLDDRVDFGGSGSAEGPGAHTLHYAFTWLHVSEPFTGGLFVGANDGVVVRLDDAVVISKHVHQILPRDRLSAAVTLTPGVHRLLVKVENNEGLSNFTLRFAEQDGTPARGVRPSLGKSDPQLGATALAMPGLFTLAELDTTLPLLAKKVVDFKAAKELELLAFDRLGISADDLYPQWFETPQKRSGQPHPGAKGFLAVHPLNERAATRILLRVALPAGAPKLHLRVSSEAFSNPREGDFVLKIGCFDAIAVELKWLHEETVGPSPTPAAPTASGWRDIDIDLSAHAGMERLLVIECAAGGGASWNCEHAFFDEISIR
ncbi:MAG: hypothetical protein EXS13_11420 [Planctomycetes bacterium]|nr:hypothetical protein [Planctomycetota bacterium]